jgi:ribosomal protein S25
MIYLRTSIPTFLKNSRMLIFGVRDDAFIKERVLAYNLDDARIQEGVEIFTQAEQAESVKTKEFGEQLEARAQFDMLLAEAEAISGKQVDFLGLAVRDDIEKQNKLFMPAQLRSRKLADWFKYMSEFYNRVLEDEDVVSRVAKYGISKENLEEGRQKIIAAQEAKIKHDRERGEAQDATLLRDTAFEKLFDLVEELSVICKYALEDRPQLLEKLGINILSPGYKRQNKKNSQEEGQEKNQEKEVTG